MKLGRNQPCHCGSGTKYKKCCMAEDKKPKLKATEPKAPEPTEPKTISLDMRRIAAHMALTLGMEQEFPRPIRNTKDSFFDHLRQTGHSEEEIKEARQIVG